MHFLEQYMAVRAAPCSVFNCKNAIFQKKFQNKASPVQFVRKVNFSTIIILRKMRCIERPKSKLKQFR